MEFKKFWLIAVLMIGTFSVSAQENYFVYLQTENNQPFYTRVNNKVISSTASGYLILPKMTEGTYELTIGFPKDEFGEENFRIDVNNKSEGYLLKHFGEKGWSLFNLQTLALVSPDTDNSSTIVTINSEIRKDPFSKMLASVTRDSALLRKNTPVEMVTAVPVKEEVEAEKEIKEAVVNTIESTKTSEEVEEVAASVEKSVEKNAAPRSQIVYNPEIKPESLPVKILGVMGRDGSEMIYVDKTRNSTDTITVFIANEKESTGSEILKTNEELPLAKKEPEFTITPTVVTPVKAENKENDIIELREKPKSEAEVSNDNKDKKPMSQVFIIRDESASSQKENKSQDVMILLPESPVKSANSDCKDFADRNDFLRIRKRMAAEKDNDAMVFAAKKIFKTKCFSTEQIRNLSYLFLSDEGKYMFFDAAYPYTSDAEKYSTLVSSLEDDYYINRFKAMIQN